MATTARKKQAEEDSIDRLIASWAPQLPDLDLEIEAIVQRMQKLTKAIRRRLEETLSDVGLAWGEWGVLGHLRLGGPPYRSSPGQLAKHEGLSSGAMTNRLDRLEERGLIRRLPDPDDRRGVQVELTDEGHRAYLEAVDVQAAKEATIASALTESEKAQLNQLLRRALLAFEQPGEPDDCK
jgi:DNA-binding MarR family transcriptional regulator